MPDALRDFASELWAILVASSLWLLLGFLSAGIVHAWVPRAWFQRHLAGRGPLAVLKASLLGVPLPLCSCSVIPFAASLRRAGAGPGPTAAFAISTPQTGEESIPLTWALFGPAFAVARPIVAVITAAIAGTLIDQFAASPKPAPEAPKTTPPAANLPTGGAPRTLSLSVLTPPPPSAPPPPPPPPATAAARVRVALHHGFGTMLRDLAPWLAIGFALSAAVAAFVPAGWLTAHLGGGLLPMLAMLVVGLPLYVCATSSTPLAAALVAAGVSPGAAMVFLLAGPATNAATMAWVLRDLGARALGIYLGTIAVIAVAAGLALDALFPGIAAHAAHAPGHEHTASSVAGLAWLPTAAAIVFSAMLLAALAARAFSRTNARPTAPPPPRGQSAAASSPPAPGAKAAARSAPSAG